MVNVESQQRSRPLAERNDQGISFECGMIDPDIDHHPLLTPRAKERYHKKARDRAGKCEEDNAKFLDLASERYDSKEAYLFYNGGTPHLFSNLKRTPFRLWRRTWHSAEQAYQAKKAEYLQDWEARDAILASNDPRECMRIGKPLYLRHSKARAEWEWSNLSRSIMHDILRAKFRKGTAAHQELMASDDRFLAEATNHPFWGYCSFYTWENARYDPEDPKGLRYLGQNWHGLILMHIREGFKGKQTENAKPVASVTTPARESPLSPAEVTETPRRTSPRTPRIPTTPQTKDVGTSPIVIKGTRRTPKAGHLQQTKKNGKFFGRRRLPKKAGPAKLAKKRPTAAQEPARKKAPRRPKPSGKQPVRKSPRRSKESENDWPQRMEPRFEVTSRGILFPFPQQRPQQKFRSAASKFGKNKKFGPPPPVWA